MKTPLQKIRRWLEQLHYTLDLRRGLRWQTNLTERKLTGDPAFHLDYPINRTEKLAMLLHECGHIERQTSVVMRGTPWDLDLFIIPPKSGKKPFSSWYIAIVREEMDAWDAADALAKKLKIEGLGRAMKRMRRKCLTTYIKWAAVRGDHTIGVPKKK